MNPGATTRPSASIVRRAGPLNLPSSTILPSLIPTSPWKEGIPEPSTMRPFLISRSYAIASFLIPVTPETSTPDGPDTHRNRRHRCYSLSRLEAGDLAPAAVSVHPFPDLRSRGSRIMPRYAVPAGRSLATTAAFSALLIAVGAPCAAQILAQGGSNRPPPPNVEANISNLHQKLQLAPAQEAPFNAVANVLRENARAEASAP